MKIERKTWILLIVIPIVYTLLFGGLFSPNVITEVPIIICNLDNGFKSQSLIRDLYDTPEIKVKSIETDFNEPVEIMIQRKASGVVIIPKDYSEKVNRGESTSIEVVVNNTNRMIGGTISKAVQSVINTESANIVVTQRIASNWNQAQAQSVQLNLSSRVLYNSTNGYIDFFLAALIMHSVQIAVIFAIAPQIVCQKRFLLEKTAFKLTTLLIEFSTVMTAVMLICLSIGFSVFGMVCHSDWLNVFLLITAFIICVVSFALCIGSWINKEYKVLLSPLVYVMPSILFANVTWSRFSMDNFSLFLSYIMPIGYAAEDLRCFLVKGTAVNWQFHFFILLMMSVFFFIFSILGVKFNAAQFKT